MNDVIRDESSSYNKNAVSFNDAVNAIDDAIDLAQRLKEGGSFLELAHTSGAFLKHAITLKMTVEYKAVMTAFAQLKQDNEEGADASAVERLVGLLNTLKQNIIDEFGAYGSEHNDSVAAYNNQKERIIANIARLEEQENNLNAAIDNYTNTIVT